MHKTDTSGRIGSRTIPACTRCGGVTMRHPGALTNAERIDGDRAAQRRRGTLRVCVDCRAINSLVLLNAFGRVGHLECHTVKDGGGKPKDVWDHTHVEPELTKWRMVPA